MKIYVCDRGEGNKMTYAMAALYSLFVNDGSNTDGLQSSRAS